ncbi:hypothetical protein D1164_13870 [Mariniphaga sediminis]|jgi:hypothetical protein|uniref:Neutral/alkaline non-lysosomal ceramidase N-terminal domain-containing protein n=2 Tax=Mariniphaga sediminis TaxID=1628158 RepID=A0A399D2U9_9BACT|nr:hypothetical protein [Mariniphaga sediminis]RIH64720.1 hypothetical protein D1164_13870 [Mariniphaga sediminis]
MSNKIEGWKILIGIYLVLLSTNTSFAVNQNPHKLYVGWSTKSITPDKPVALSGQFGTRISREIMDSVTCTAMAIETRNGDESIETAIMVSCDLVVIRGGLLKKVTGLLKKELPEFNSNKLILNATHTHTGPVLTEGRYEIPEEAIQPAEYVKFAAEQIVNAAVEAWKSRKPAGMSWGLGQAVVGNNRRAVYFSPVPSGFGEGTAVMYGKTDRVDFSHIEGYEDHGLEMMFFWDEQKKLTGMVLNIACPTQETESLTQLSADFWHEARVELHKRYGKDVYILPQVAAAGDISPHLLWRKEAEMEMLKRKGINRRQEIGLRIANAVDEVFPYVQDDIKNEVVFNHLYDELFLPVRKVTKEEADQSEKLAKEQPDRASWHRGIIDRYNKQDKNPYYPVKVNVMRLDDVVFATNPFELFLDFGLRIKTRSDAVLTFVVQLANGNGTYVPTAKAEAGGGYSAIVQSNSVGSEGGQVLVEKTVEMISKTMK